MIKILHFRNSKYACFYHIHVLSKRFSVPFYLFFFFWGGGGGGVAIIGKDACKAWAKNLGRNPIEQPGSLRVQIKLIDQPFLGKKEEDKCHTSNPKHEFDT
jgi:hypothetical protein